MFKTTCLKRSEASTIDLRSVASLLALADTIERGYPALVRYFDESAIEPLIEVFEREVERSATIPRADYVAYALAKA